MIAGKNNPKHYRHRIGVLLVSSLLLSQAQAQAQAQKPLQEYRCAMILADNEPYIGRYQYQSEYKSMDKMQKSTIEKAGESVFQADGTTLIAVKKVLECAHSGQSFTSDAAKAVEENFDY
ncbi:TapY2 family type IVa secretion system protein [Motilimonas sp. 1_MG-2023]|uniref:TapY2 family type IVa secretion system protein n=1 Tax=Motilimonas sp. 1_MG-2023 TaxID=3062672 RepID=UPI0026E3B2B0|nr:TapY2 family type IVa secretion system protein [Motilimonas sp. 1_MG-2023]MDO6525685.1 TapY2 family type IVa secretion system protein [Motilimonas sp. 1_MG-2023]